MNKKNEGWFNEAVSLQIYIEIICFPSVIFDSILLKRLAYHCENEVGRLTCGRQNSDSVGGFVDRAANKKHKKKTSKINGLQLVLVDSFKYIVVFHKTKKTWVCR